MAADGNVLCELWRSGQLCQGIVFSDLFNHWPLLKALQVALVIMG